MDIQELNKAIKTEPATAETVSMLKDSVEYVSFKRFVEDVNSFLERHLFVVDEDKKINLEDLNARISAAERLIGLANGYMSLMTSSYMIDKVQGKVTASK